MKLQRLTFLAMLGVLILSLNSSSSLASGFFGNTLAGYQKYGSNLNGFYVNSQGVPLVNLIDQANSTLDIEIYEMDDPKVIAAIRRALYRGVIVHIIKEPNPVGSACRVFDVFNSTSYQNNLKNNSQPATCEDQQQLVADVNNANGQYVPFTKPDLCGGNGNKNCLEHGKIAVVDSKLALISSGNFNTTNLCDLDYSPDTCNRDYSYVTDDSDIVNTLQNVVEKDLLGQRYDVDSLISSAAAQKTTVGPDSLQPIVSFIQSAQHEIQLENQYLKDPTMNAALISAARRGVKVQVVVASACSFGRPRENESRQLATLFRNFETAGIEIKMFNKNILVNGQPGYLHAKAILVDQKYAWMGSVNGSTQALTLNREFGVFFDNPSDVRKLESTLNSDFSDPHEESWQKSLDCAENN